MDQGKYPYVVTVWQLSRKSRGHVTAEKGSCIHKGTNPHPPPSELR